MTARIDMQFVRALPLEISGFFSIIFSQIEKMSEPCFKCKNSECLTTFNQRIICPHCQRPAQVIYPRASPKETPEAAIVLVLGGHPSKNAGYNRLTTLLDGGGMRGLSSLFILKALMEEVQKVINSNDEPLPGNYFTFIMGTSTGGLVSSLYN